MAYNGYNDARKKANDKYLKKFINITFRITPEEKKIIEDKGSVADKDAAYEENAAELEDTVNTITEEAIKVVCEKGDLQLEEGKLFVLTILKASGLNIGDCYGRKDY